ncbi:amidohydrolase [Gammaproteobacteria bacterium]|nr:amidohydrolase [Gammaproteobacteria bacterium]
MSNSKLNALMGVLIHELLNVTSVKFTGISIVVVITLLSACSLDEPPSLAADKIFTNGTIYTVDANNSQHQAMAVSGGVIIAVGSAEEIEILKGEQTEVTDLNGGFVMPGIQDMHVHPVDGGIKRLFECAFGAELSSQEIVEAVSQCVSSADDASSWIQGGQWGTTILEQGPGVHRSMLDAVSGDHPVFLMDWSVHNAWVNSKALTLLGIDDHTPNPVGGEIVRDADGKATGLLFDNAAYNSRKLIPDYSSEQLQRALSFSMSKMMGFGITSFRDAITNNVNLAAYLALDERGELPLRVKPSIPWKSAWSSSHEQEIKNIEQHKQYASDRIDASFAKIMLDGVPLVYSSAVLEPYEPSEQHGDKHLGELMIKPDALSEDVAWLDSQGMTVKIHATGDRAVRTALDAIEHARNTNVQAGAMHEVSHAEMIHPDDLVRFDDLNVAAEMCPILWYPGPAVDTMKITLGDRANYFWPVKSLTEAGALVFYGSDWPAVVPDTNPWPGIEAMISREDPYGKNQGKYWPEQAVDLRTVLRIFTFNGAIAGKQEKTTGSLEAGKRADFIVLESNIFELPTAALSDVQVMQTFVDGEAVFQRVHAGN